MRPLKRADTGPMRDDMTIEYALSPARSNDSQPGMHAFRIAGSFSASHTADGRAGTMRVLDSSIRAIRSGRAGDGGFATLRAGQCAREVGQRFQIVHRKEIVDIRHERPDAGRPRLESGVAKQR